MNSRAILSTWGAIAALASLSGFPSALGQEVHYSPEEDLARIDAQLIGSAKTSIDFASYALTDRVIIAALTSADHRGVAIRIVLDPRERHDFVALGDLSDNVRIKRGGPFMHLKAYSSGLAHRLGEFQHQRRAPAGQRSVRDSRFRRRCEVRRPFRAHVGRSAAHDRVRTRDQGAGAELERPRSARSLGLARKRSAERRRHGVPVALVGHVGIVLEELLEGAHDLLPLQTWRRAVDLLSSKRSGPIEAAREGACDDLGEHPHAGVLILPTRKQPPRRNIRRVRPCRT